VVAGEGFGIWDLGFGVNLSDSRLWQPCYFSYKFYEGVVCERL
jgi:hypothetical protein